MFSTPRYRSVSWSWIQKFALFPVAFLECPESLRARKRTTSKTSTCQTGRPRFVCAGSQACVEAPKTYVLKQRNARHPRQLRGTSQDWMTLRFVCAGPQEMDQSPCVPQYKFLLVGHDSVHNGRRLKQRVFVDTMGRDKATAVLCSP